MKFEAKSARVAQNAFKALRAPGSGAFTNVETGHVDTFDLKPDEAGRRYLQSRIKAGGTILIVAVPDDEVAATYFGGGSETAANRPRLSVGGESAN